LAWVVVLGVAIAIGFELRRLDGVGPEPPPSQPQVEAVASVPSAQRAAPSSGAEPEQAAAGDRPAASSAPITEPGDQPLPALPSAILSLLPSESGSEEFRQQAQDFAAQPRDSLWAAETEARILARTSETGDVALVDIQVECRTTTCVVFVAYPPGAAVDPVTESRALGRALHLIPGPRMTALELDGSARRWTFWGLPPRPAKDVSQDGDARDR
jgi:hypothetical protein